MPAQFHVAALRRRMPWALLLANALVLPCSLYAQSAGTSEYVAKAKFLAAFPNFVEWPPEAFPSEASALSICVFGDFSFGPSLAEVTRGMVVHGHKLEVRWIRKEQDLRTCQVLFVSASESSHFRNIAKAIQGASVLTVGETSDFLASGGVINFVTENSRLTFEVNMEAAEDAHLSIRATMLSLARRVISKSQVANLSAPGT